MSLGRRRACIDAGIGLPGSRHRARHSIYPATHPIIAGKSGFGGSEMSASKLVMTEAARAPVAARTRI
ncbi:MAG: hypothetical protein ACRCVA_28245, partial [Phreatobacter sp.]